MARSANAVCPCGLTRVARSREASFRCLQPAVHPDNLARPNVAVCAIKQDRESLSVTTQSQPLTQNPDLKTYTRRRWSNLNGYLVHVPGTVLGSATLIAGTTIGAGILALPAVTKDAGFVPSCATLLGCYFFSAMTGLFITEVNINTVCELGSGAVSLQSMVERTLGKGGARFASATYIFLHYSLLVAYISRAGGSIASTTGQPLWLTAAVFASALAGLCYTASPRQLDTANTALLALVILSFLGLLWVALPGVSLENLQAGSWPAVVDTLPVVALAFVFQNVVPVVVTQLEGDVKKVRIAVWTGLAIPLVMFIGWEGAMLGSLAPGFCLAFIFQFCRRFAGTAGLDPVTTLRELNPVVAPLIEGFSFLAIATSFIGFILGLTDFFMDALALSNKQRYVAYGLTVVPPYFFALAFPDIFFQALDLAGTYGVLVLFGIIPCAMIYSERYWQTTLTTIRVVPEGRLLMLGIGGFAALIIINELLHSILSLASGVTQ